MARAVLLEMCLSCLLLMSEEELSRLLLAMTSVLGDRTSWTREQTDLETRLFECIEANLDTRA